MSEYKISDGIIIDEIETVIERLEARTGFNNIDINDIVEFIKNEPGTLIYVDEKFNIKFESDESLYLWIDSGFEDKAGGTLFISLLKQYGEYVGHYAGNHKFLMNNITAYYPQNYKAVHDNEKKFETKYEQKVEQRLIKHLTEKYRSLQGNDPESFKGYEIIEEEKPVEQKERVISFSTYDNNVQYSSTDLASVIREQLLVDNFQTLGGFERYLKVIGSRIWQLVENGKEEYYAINKTKSVIINTGLLDKYGVDVKVMYRVNLTTKTYDLYQYIGSKQEFLSNNFSKEQANQIIKPISFLDEGESFSASIDEFDINTRSLKHIVEERRDRFPDNIKEMSSDKLAQRINDALLLGLKMQERDNSYVKPSYSGKTKTISWAMPLHINNEFTDEPELVLVVSKQNDFYEIKTVLPYDDVVRDRITALALYAKLW